MLHCSKSEGRRRMGEVHAARCCRSRCQCRIVARHTGSAATSGETNPMNPRSSPDQLVTLPTIASVFSRIGLSSFGGGLIAWMHREAVERRRWVGDQEFLSGLAIRQVLPGGNMVNMSLYLGTRLRGALGALTAVPGRTGLPRLAACTPPSGRARFTTRRP